MRPRRRRGEKDEETGRRDDYRSGVDDGGKQ